MFKQPALQSLNEGTIGDFDGDPYSVALPGKLGSAAGNHSWDFVIPPPEK